MTAATTVQYLAPGYADILATTVPTQFRCPVGGTLRNLRIRHNVPGGVSANRIVYTVRVANAITALKVEMLPMDTDGQNLIDAVLVAEGDLLDIEITKPDGAIGTTPREIMAAIELTA